ncbi:8145_t:CDS:10 [Ambispora leptoticha]|uniref:TATA-binding protein-associated factor mot1 n=1 Tax=Ambispora leptoticha TaxID=144679 RepID=A0A9N9AHL0_9GLOM|nr:8145_t:CDS:10 [Ambispora leptoticha]
MSDNVAHALSGRYFLTVENERAGGGIIAMTLTYPLVTVSSRLQVQKNNEGANVYKGSIDALVKIFNNEGIRGLYSGLTSAIFGIAVSNGVYYYFYELTKAFFEKSVTIKRDISTVESMIAGALAGCVTVLFTNPIWVVNTRMTTRKESLDDNDTELKESLDDTKLKGESKRLGTLATILKIIKDDGPSAFWAGVMPAFILVANPIIQYTVFEQLKARLQKAKKLGNLDFFLLGALSKLAATVVTYPYIVIKSRMQLRQSHDSKTRYDSTLDGIRKIVTNEGIGGLYKGINSKLLQSVLTAALDRLVLLLDTGSTPAVRLTAAQQLGEIQKQHPSELYNLLSRVVVHLRSKNWETRIAAGQAIEAIANNLPQWDPAESAKSEHELVNSNKFALENKYSFDNFDIANVLQGGKLLLGSAGKEYDFDLSELDPAVRLALQRKNLSERLGLGSQFMDVDLFDESDIADADLSGLSAREKNKLKRKAKKDAKDKGKDKVRVVDIGRRRPSVSEVNTPIVTPATGSISPSGVKIEEALKPEGYFNFTPQPCSDKIVVEAKKESGLNVLESQSNGWPFEGVCELLCMDLFDPCWEVRHGAGIGLREILKVHGYGAGRVGCENDERHYKWLEDVAIRLLCVFSLDRFGDFVSDQVVAPVRETCSQTLGALLRYMSPQGVKKVHEILLRLIYQTDFSQNNFLSIWEVRHAGMLGLKYAVAVRRDLVELMLEGTVGAVVLGLKDADDDVRAVAASILLPIADSFIKLSAHNIPEVVTVLWDCLKDLKDDLTASTANVMDLLAKLFSFPSVLDYMRKAAASDPSHSLKTLVPRLYPFFRHTITSVRTAVLNTLLTFLGMEGVDEWVDDQVFRLVFQNMIVEEKRDVLDLSLQLWSKLLNHTTSDDGNNKITLYTASHIRNWFSIIMTPLGTPLPQRLFFIPDGSMISPTTPTTSSASTHAGRRPRGPKRTEESNGNSSSISHNVDAGMLQQDFALVSVESVVRGRVTASKGLGLLMSKCPQEYLEATFKDIILSFLSSALASNRQLSSVIIEEWARAAFGNIAPDHDILVASFPLASCLSSTLISSLESEPPAYYVELLPILRRIRGECQALLNSFVSDAKISLDLIPSLPTNVLGEPGNADNSYFCVETAVHIVSDTFDQLSANIHKNRKSIIEALDDRKRRVLSSIGFYESSKQKLDTNVYAAISGAIVALRVLPPKLNPVIRSIMNSIKTEENCELQERSAATLASLVALCSSDKNSGRVNPNDKIAKNLCAFLCQDQTNTPVLQNNRNKEGILSLQKAKENNSDANKEEELKAQKLVRRGAETALRQFASQFGPNLFQVVPKLWNCIHSSLHAVFVKGNGEEKNEEEINSKLNATDAGQDVIDSLQVLQILTPAVHESLHSKITELLPQIIKAVQCKYSVIRYVAARCFATIANVVTIPSMQIIIDQVIPFLGDSQSVIHRQGAAELIYHVVQTMDAKILPYVIFMIVPVLGRMSDADESVRLVTTNCFAMLIKLVPLEAGIPNPPGLSPKLLQHREDERRFLAQLLDSRKLDQYEIPVAINAELRKYQQEGVNWLAFLSKYQLHGILCDDMGLGKTLQSICILASDHYTRAMKYKKTKSPDCAHAPSLVVCPPTLTGHWYHEILHYTNSLKPLSYIGGPKEREKLRPKILEHDVIIMSYDIVRNDIEELANINWNYCILDEGHVIKNGRTKITKAVKSVKANHRLILSGTPIQNNVLELWSLFDFLMPGFLGTEKQFNERFGKPILSSRDSKSSSKEQEAGALALEALHKQVLPFLLRRLKEDVLNDLPPKIIQDYYCELSDLQKQLYEQFAKSQAKSNVESELDSEAEVVEEKETKKATHIFQALQYLRKLCNHPLLVVNDKHPQYNSVMERLKKNKSSLHDLQNAPKLLALKQLLLDCGIGISPETENNSGVEGAVSQHRALIFCQLKTMLDIIETDLFKPLMPSVSYMRLDGSVDANKRHGIVQKFNQDPSYDVLLLTTHVGGLGLNLTGADTVIFVEHDWNPMKDLQAMDRAHRIGQKKVVNVYRLITRGTLEEKIMGLQKFKLNIANSIVNQQNSGLQSMDTDQILDLFNVTSHDTKSGTSVEKTSSAAASSASLTSGNAYSNVIGGGSKGKKASTKIVLENLENLWEDTQYEDLNLDNFIESLNTGGGSKS